MEEQNTNPDSQNSPAKRKKKDSSTDTDDLVTSDIQVRVHKLINRKLDVLGMLHKEIKHFSKKKTNL